VGYPGGKAGAGVYQTIINLMPPHDVYIEPFLGGGAVMRLKRPARLNIGVDLVGSARLAMPDPLAAGGEESSFHLPGGIARNGGPRATLKTAMSAETGGNGDSRSTIAENGERRRGSARLAMRYPLVAGGDVGPSFEFVHGDGIAFLKSYRYTGRELVYCDPPYLHSTRSSHFRYEFEMSDVDHRRLLRVVMALPCRVMISGYRSAMYMRTLGGWNLETFQAMTRGGMATEYLWFNFERPVELHDYRYLGRGFRERERIKRKKQRWTERLLRMPQLERCALLAAVASIGTGGDGVLR
jgi:hypothetical protein